MADQSYTLQFTDPTKTVVVPPLTINGPLLPSTTETYPNSSGSSTSIGLVGRGEPNYGRVILNNLLQMLEHFSYPTSPTNPVIGQLWHNSVTNSLNLFTDAGWVDVTGNDVFVKKTGGEMAGTLTFPVDTKLHLNYTPVSQVDAINVLYADTKYLAKTGGTVTGNLTISNGSRITSSAIPTTNAHLTNKLYVDQAIDSISLTNGNNVIKLIAAEDQLQLGNNVKQVSGTNYKHSFFKSLTTTTSTPTTFVHQKTTSCLVITGKCYARNVSNAQDNVFDINCLVVGDSSITPITSSDESIIPLVQQTAGLSLTFGVVSDVITFNVVGHPTNTINWNFDFTITEIGQP